MLRCRYYKRYFVFIFTKYFHGYITLKDHSLALAGKQFITINQLDYLYRNKDIENYK
jgi:hypothetical protein